ncbi:3-hydroxybutyryl-CoA dehydrogenase-like protein, partial [Trifolium pratense]
MSSSFDLVILGLHVIGMHFMNPPPVMKLIEIVRGADTSDGTFAATKELSQSLSDHYIPAIILKNVNVTYVGLMEDDELIADVYAAAMFPSTHNF